MDTNQKIGGLVLSIVATLLLLGCGPEKEPVCTKPKHDVVVVAHTSKSDLEMSREIAPAIQADVVDLAVASCGSLSLGIMGGRTAAAQLDLVTHEFVPEKRTTYGQPKPVLAPLMKEADAFYQDALLAPLADLEAAKGSPYLNGLAQIAMELSNGGTKKAVVILIGDGLSVEPAPDGGNVNSYKDPINTDAAMSFVPLLEPLAGSCVLLIRSTIESDVTDEQLRTAHDVLGQVLEAAGAGLVVTTSTSDLPIAC